MEAHSWSNNSNNHLSNLRAAVLGANDGIVSTAGLIMGVTGASASKETILLAGVAGLVAGALSMGAGEFVSVSSQRDSEKSLIARHKHHVTTLHDDSDFEELVSIYGKRRVEKNRPSHNNRARSGR